MPEKPKDPILEWPYARDFVLETMDHDAIQRHGELILCRALNIGRTVAFVGSGVSMAYGRISWRDLVREAVQQAAEEYKKYKDRARQEYDEYKTRLEGIPSPREARIHSLYGTLAKLRPRPDDGSRWREIEPPNLIMLFQIADQLSQAIHEFNGGASNEANLVRKAVQQLVYDDAGHARRLLEAAATGGRANVPDDVQKRLDDILKRLELNLDKRKLGRRLDPNEAAWHSIFKIQMLRRILKKRISRELREVLLGYVAVRDAPNEYLNPTHRFVVAAGLAALKQNSRNDLLKSVPPARAKAPRIRSKIVDAARDPLGILVEQLRIGRFVTTNYDLDIERLMLDNGYAPPEHETHVARIESSVTESANALYGRARDFVFETRHPAQPVDFAQLIDFAVQDKQFALDVAHLHGRATEDNRIIATEADYQRLYLRDENGHGRDLIDGAIDLTFRGNALLFVGNGMGEDDLLRPLRHFMGEGTPGGEQVAIALLPDLKGKKERVEQKALLLRRYGVYAVHYGRGSVIRQKGKYEAARAEYIRRNERYVLASLTKIVRFLVKTLGAKTKDDDRSEVTRVRRDAIRGLRRAWIYAPFRFPDDNGTLAVEGLPIHIEGSQDRGLTAELRTIRYLFDVCLRSGPVSAEERHAARVLAENLEDAIVAAFLCAALQRLKREWDHWRSDWLGGIRPRLPRIRPKPDDRKDARRWFVGGLTHPKFRIDRRRAIRLRDYDGRAGVERTGRQFQVKWSQTLALTCEALRRHRANSAVMARTGRRVFVLAGPRGVGKGHFFSALTERDGLFKFLQATWGGGSADGPPPRDPYIGAFAFNLSFSVEIGSGFDRLVDFLSAQIHELYDEPARTDFARRYKDVSGRDVPKVGPEPREGEVPDSEADSTAAPRSGDRIGALDFVMRVLSGRSEFAKPPGRFVLLFNAIHLLFSPSGFSKSADVTRLISALLQSDYGDAAVDIVFVTDERGVPTEFRERSRAAKKPALPRLPEKAPFEWTVEVARSDVDPTRHESEDRAAVRRIRLREYRLGLPPTAPQSRDVAVFLRLRPSPFGVVAAAAFPKVLAAIVADQRSATRDQGARSRTLRPDAKDTVEGILADMVRTGSGLVDREQLENRLVRACLCQGDTPAGPHQRAEGARQIEVQFQSYFKAFGGSRFALTIAFAAADEELSAQGDRTGSAVETLRTIREAVRGIDDTSRADMVVRVVLDMHRQRGVREECFDGIVARKWLKRAGMRLTLAKLCDELLVVLSMIGYPIEADCLAGLPFEAIGSGRERDHAADLVKAALDILVRRCLVFRFAPNSDEENRTENGEGKEAASKGQDRFGVHRHVQRRIFRHLQQPLVENAEIELYMPTLYASQPNDLPYPTAMAQQRIREVVGALSGYPGRKERRLRSATDPDAHLQARMLRGAYGVVRSVYGVGVVARFHEHGAEGSRPKLGYFEEHRRQVRWLIRRAKEFGELTELDAGRRGEADGGSRRLPARRFKKLIQASDLPLYASEIAWLYNECGVLSLAQGQLDDASAFLAMAVRALEPVERRGTPAALAAVVRLNRALVDIEQGNLRKADAALRDIIAQRDEHRASRWIATGYRGLIEHVRGDLDNASALYDDAVRVLTAMKRYRAASIFSRHFADLHRRLGGKDGLEEAERRANDAVNLAMAGSHADVLQQARLARLQIRARREGPKAFAELRKELDDIEAYAKVMGMSRLEVETAFVDASFRRELGDLVMAMKRVTRSLAIANDCDLVLRKIGGMLLAAEISSDLGMRDGARTLAETARASAIAAEYSIAQDKAQNLLASL